LEDIGETRGIDDMQEHKCGVIMGALGALVSLGAMNHDYEISKR
jgi:hypothetical protein